MGTSFNVVVKRAECARSGLPIYGPPEVWKRPTRKRSYLIRFTCAGCRRLIYGYPSWHSPLWYLRSDRPDRPDFGPYGFKSREPVERDGSPYHEHCLSKLPGRKPRLFIAPE
jgi:hypothetical protein